MKLKINKTLVGDNYPTYFIADIAANHDGKLSRAKKLIKLCALAGANAAKFQHFKAETIVSDYGFKKINRLTHQKKWKKTVFQVYKEASLNPEWNSELQKTCSKYNIDYMTAPYDFDYVDDVNKYISAYKIGSGDITWIEIIKKIASKKKPVILATGASSMEDVERALKCIKKINKKIVLMQCNTNYTGSQKNIECLNLNVLKTFKKKFGKNIILGLSDHTFGHLAVLGAVTLGAKVVEKHFTDNNSRKGPDHNFSMNPKTWKEMVCATRNLEKMFGDGVKRIEKNEKKSMIVQRRSIRAKIKIAKNTIIRKDMLINLRPITSKGIPPYNLNKILNKRTKANINCQEEITWKKIKS
jgi:sialic acid synthase SpsE